MSEPHFVLPKAGVTLAEVNGLHLLLVPHKELLYSVTPPVADAWEAIELGVEMLRSDAAGVPPGGILHDLMQIGAIEPLSTLDGPARITCCETLELAGLTLGVAFEDEALRAELMPDFAHLATEPRRVEEYVVVQRAGGRIGVGRRNEELEYVARQEAVPLLKIKITEILFDLTGHVMLHAAQLVRGGRCLLLLGDAGAGKSTLATALETAEFRLCSDDIVLLSAIGELQALPFPVTLKEGAWRLLGHRREEIDQAAPHVRPDALSVRYLGVSKGAGWCEAGWVLVLDRHASGPASVHELELPEVFAALLGAAWSGEDAMSPEVFSAMAACLNGARFGRLTYADLSEAVTTVSRFCGGEEVGRSEEGTREFQ